MKTIILSILMALAIFSSNAQNQIKGKITDNNNIALQGVSVFIPELNKGTITNENGLFTLDQLPNGKIKLQASLLGYSTVIKSIELKGEKVEINLLMNEAVVEYEEIVISGTSNSSQHDNAVKIEKIKINMMDVKSSPNFTEMLTKVPGVNMISKGPGVSKPVIRGLSMNDILILNNGVRFENYQYSNHHPLGIDEFGIENVEIIKGPASLLYGSDAIGGVINLIKEKPAPVGSFIGDYNLQMFSNSLGMNNNLGIRGSSGKFFGGIRLGQKTNSDYLQGGGDFVPNSRFNEVSAKANAGFSGKKGIINFYYDYNNQKLGLVEEEAIEEITERGRKNEIFYQQFNNHLFSNQNRIYFGKLKLDLNAAFQSTELVHFAEPGIYELQMRLNTITYESKLNFQLGKNSDFIVGFQGINQTNTNLNNRETILLPNARTISNSLFGLFQNDFTEKLKFQAGLRYDIRQISTEETGTLGTEDFRKSLNKDYNNISGSAGITWRGNEHVFIRANIAKAYRTPNIAELTSKGQHEAIYELGDENLVPENSYEGDLSLHMHKDNYTVDFAIFYNYIFDFIYIGPTADTSSEGLPVYKYSQSDSKLYGGEAGIHLHPKAAEWLHLEANYSLVRGLKENENYLPFIPADNLKTELRFEGKNLKIMKRPYLSINTDFVFTQNKIAQEETATDGYTLLNLALGTDILFYNQPISIGISINNIFDKKYADHMSTLKEVNLLEPGRNFTFSLKVPFGKINSKGNM
ncbi:MAG: TonB-dependent receptor [Bacteroidales bacterium]